MANQEMEFHSVCCQSQTCTGLCASGLFSPPLNCVIEVVQEVFLRCFEIVKTICYKASPVCSLKFRLVIPASSRCGLNLDPEQSR